MAMRRIAKTIREARGAKGLPPLKSVTKLLEERGHSDPLRLKKAQRRSKQLRLKKATPKRAFPKKSVTKHLNKVKKSPGRYRA